MVQIRTYRIEWPTLAVIAIVAWFAAGPGLAATRTDSLASLKPEQPSFGLSTTRTRPDPSLSAEDVVRIQMRGLQKNGAADQ